MELYVRAKTMEAIDCQHRRVDEALKAGGAAVGAKAVIETLPGMFPLACSPRLNDLFVENIKEYFPETKIEDADILRHLLTWVIFLISCRVSTRLSVVWTADFIQRILRHRFRCGGYPSGKGFCHEYH